MIVAAPDGKNIDFGNLAPDQVTAAMQKAYPPQGQFGAGDYLQQVAKGGTFGLVDEIGAGLGAAKMAVDRGSLNNFGQDYNVGLTGLRQDQAAFEQAHPYQSVGLQVLGGLGTGGAAGINGAGKSLMAGFGGSGLQARIASGTATGAASGAAYGFGTGEGDQRLQSAGQGALLGGAFGAAVPAISGAASQVGKAFVPDIEQGTAQLAKRAQDFGIPLRMDQVAPSRVRNTVQKVSQEIPFSGVENFDKNQTTAFNRSVAKTIGEDADNLSPNVVQSFRTNNSGKFDEAFSGQQFNFTNMVKKDLDNIAEEAKSTIDIGLSSVVQDNVNKTWEQLKSGRLSGEKLASIRSELLKRMTRMKNSASPYVGDIIDKLDDIAEAQMPPEKLQMLGDARRQYRNFKTVQPLLEKSTDGNINPTQLINRVASSKYIDASKIPVGQDDLVDLARIGKQFMPKLGGSDTFQKAAMGTGLTGLGGLMLANPALGLGVAAKAGIGFGANRLFQSGINQSQSLVGKAVNKSLQFPKNANRVTVRPSDKYLPVRK